ncbi:MAG: hypothetical protein IPO48_02225 [Saprospiraceae bacterium]|nr:hypothetical protein [Saprospiraceae bacterium]
MFWLTYQKSRRRSPNMGGCSGRLQDRLAMLQVQEEQSQEFIRKFSAAEGTEKDWYGESAFTSKEKAKKKKKGIILQNLIFYRIKNNSDPIEMIL